MTDTADERPPRRVWHRNRKPLGDHVAARIAALQRDYLGKRGPSATASAAATLARLRRAVNTEPGAVLDAYDFDLIPEELQAQLHGDEPTVPEIAVHTAITLYATHQQSQTDQGMHVNGPSFATAVRLFALQTEASREAVERRFARAGTAASLDELKHHGRGLVTQLRGAGIGLDYGLFTDDLCVFLGDDGPRRLRGLWGRDYWRLRGDKHDDNDTHEEQQQ